MYFQDMFTIHVGTDTSFQFEWLKEGFNASEAIASLEGEFDDRCYRP